ncbi:phosphotransferase family protein [Cohnella caldifontis]|uniref:phosphotransferase family protein n=1 Tax=Cohnella caldifontis TaxID=3027471 RepID=UPI0023ED538F|nr:aminoglycoside phosphotransferase family protein [Cohnella sp. YIM B05605]
MRLHSDTQGGPAIESLTKRTLNETEMKAVVRRAFGQGISMKRMEALTDGWFNAAYRVALSDGKECVVKVSPPDGARTLRYERNLMKAEAEALKAIRALGDVPVPRLYHEEFAREVLDCDLIVMEKLEGVTYNRLKERLPPERIAEADSAIGRCNRRINEIRGEWFGYIALPEHGHAKWKDAFRMMVRWLFEDGREAGVELPYDTVWRLVEDRLPLLDAVTEPRLVYWDLWDGNVMVREDGTLTGLFDAERALWGDPLMEYHFSSFSQSEAFWEAYGLDPRAPENAERRKLYDLHLALVLRIECAYRGFEGGHLEWAARNLAERIAAMRD